VNPGDRIRLVGTDEDGLPFVRYGFITPNSPDPTSSPTVTVMLDGELSGEAVPHDHVELVTVANIELRLFGADLVDDPTLRRGLLPMWLAEAETAGVALDKLCPNGDGALDQPSSWLLAFATAGDDRYAIRACVHAGEPPMIHVHAVTCVDADADCSD
jgi:hypothetical protein